LPFLVSLLPSLQPDRQADLHSNPGIFHTDLHRFLLKINPDFHSSILAFLTGIRDCLPVVLGYLAIGLAFGVLARTAGLSILEVLLLSTLLYAGSAQFIFASLVAGASAPLAVVITIFLVNVRHSLYSAALSPYLRQQPLWKNMLIGAQLTDETFALATSHLVKGRTADPAWLFGINLTAQLAWIAATTFGALLGQAITNINALRLDFALAAMWGCLERVSRQSLF